ncbi:MAG: hypothetical protein E7253_05525 [Lachnospiraceae bacterium]|nr:hypothetical protein [Lachnospiraceae bacterium]
MFREILIHINGTKSITIENYKNILDYKDDFILIQGKEENLCITGKSFRIDYFTHESMCITGTVEKLEFRSAGMKSDRR